MSGSANRACELELTPRLASMERVHCETDIAPALTHSWANGITRLGRLSRARRNTVL